MAGVAAVVVAVLAVAYVSFRAPGGGAASHSKGQAVTEGQAVTWAGVEFTLLDTQCSTSNVGTPGYTWVGFQVRAQNTSPAIFQDTMNHWVAATDGQWFGEVQLQPGYNGGWPATWQPLLGSWFVSALDPGRETTGWFVFRMPIAKDHIAFGFTAYPVGLVSLVNAPPSSWVAEWDTHCP